MSTEQELKNVVKRRYAQIAEQEYPATAASCCGATAPAPEVYHLMSDDYTGTNGYVEAADLGLGCGLPTQFANIQKGDTVIDLGSGAGNDCFVARYEAGAEGTIIGIDFTPSMVQKARANAVKLGLTNVEFREGDVDQMPVPDNAADVVVSNCVLNLVPDKKKVFNEIFRVLKPGGHFSISDVVHVGHLPEGLQKDEAMYAGCVAGAIPKDAYLQHIKDAGFKHITLQKQKPIHIPEDILGKHLTARQLADFSNSENGIFSITVYAEKPGRPSEKH